MLDPPAFAKSRGDVAAARRGYKEINVRALRLLAPGGVSGHVVVLVQPRRAVVRGHPARSRRGRAVAMRSSASGGDRRPTIPCGSAFPEGRYLKCFVLRVASGAP